MTFRFPAYIARISRPRMFSHLKSHNRIAHAGILPFYSRGAPWS